MAFIGIQNSSLPTSPPTDAFTEGIVETLTMARACGSTSLFFCGGVVLTGLVFPHFMLNSRRVFPQILFFISLCDMICALAYTFGYPKSGTTLCGMQALFLMAFNVASWTWTLLLVFQLRCAIIFRRIFLSTTSMHVLCWTISTFSILLPAFVLQDNFWVYNHSEETICFFSNSKKNEELITMTFFYSFLWFVDFSMAFLLIEVFLHFRKISGSGRQNSSDALEKITSKIFRNMIAYPLVMALFSIPVTVEMLIIAHNYDPKGKGSKYFDDLDLYLFNILDNIKMLSGAALAILFFILSAEARDKWSMLLGWEKRPIGDGLTNSLVTTSETQDEIRDTDDEQLYMTSDVSSEPSEPSSRSGTSFFHVSLSMFWRGSPSARSSTLLQERQDEQDKQHEKQRVDSTALSVPMFGVAEAVNDDDYL